MKKKILKISIIASLLIVLFSCDNFLDIVPKGKVKPETSEDYRGVLTSAYSIIPSDKGYLAMRSDEANYDYSDKNSTKEAYKNYFIWKDNDVEYQSDYNYRNYYKVIYCANHVIDNKNGMSGKQSDINQLVGEAYLLRAYIHFSLVNLYAKEYTEANRGEKSIVVSAKNDMDASQKRSSLGEVYDFILKDINISFSYLNVKEQTPDYRYRFSIISAYAFKSRFFLYQQKWDSCIDYSNKVLSIKDTIQNLALDKYSTPTFYNSVEVIQSMEKIISSDFLKSIFVSDTLRNKYKFLMDYRYTSFYDAITQTVWDIKKSSSDQYRTTFRVSEIYLNMSESCARINDLDKAKFYLLKLLKYRLKSSFYNAENTRINAINDKETLVKEILNERFKELAFEGHRWFDLKRTTKPQIKHTLGNEGTYILKENDEKYVIAFPLEAKAGNPNLLY